MYYKLWHSIQSRSYKINMTVTKFGITYFCILLLHYYYIHINNNIGFSLSMISLVQAMLRLRCFSHQPLTMGAQVWSQVSPCEICDGRRGTETHFSLGTSVLPIIIILSTLHTHSFIYHQWYIVFINWQCH
jgi:hypothetical protein